MTHPPISHPEWDDLLGKRDAYQAQIAAVIADLHALDHSLPVILGQYAAAFGERMKNLHALEIEGARLKREIELIQATINTGGELDFEKIQETLELEFAEWQAKIEAEAAELAKQRQVLNHLLDPKTTAELRTLFRTLARRLHPDLHPDQSAADAELWHRVSAAYEFQNLEELRAIEILTRDAVTTPVPDTMDALRDSLEQYRLQLERLLLTLAARRKEWPFDQVEIITDPTATAARQAELDARIHAASAVRDERKIWLNQLLDH